MKAIETIVERSKRANKFSLIDPATGWARRYEFKIITSERGGYTGQYGRSAKTYASVITPEHLTGNTFINACLLPYEDKVQAGTKVYKGRGEIAEVMSTTAFVKGKIKNDHNSYYAISEVENGFVLEETAIV